MDGAAQLPTAASSDAPPSADAAAAAVGSFEDALRRHEAAHCESGTDKTTTHAYGPLYSRLFAPLRLRARQVLEIGVYSGASVLAMAEYFERAQVVGMDVTLGNVRFGREHPRVRLLLQDGTRPDALRALAELGAMPLDLVLDDASHLKADQLASFRLLAPLLRRGGGMYVIEDIMADDGLQAFLAELDAARVDILGGASRLEVHDLRAAPRAHGRPVPDDIVAVLHC